MTIEVTMESMYSGAWNKMTLNCTPEEYRKGITDYRAGRLIQDAFPMLTPDEREFILTGTTPEEWDEMFGEEE